MNMWEPSAERIQRSHWAAFTGFAEQTYGRPFEDPHALYRWSVQCPEEFWSAVWQYCGVISSRPYSRVLIDSGRIYEACWFEGAALNYAENLLRYRDGQDALVFWGEDRSRRCLTYAQLYEMTARLARSLQAAGVAQGDRVAGFLPNLPEAIVAMLATAAVGAVWSSCSADFGVQGVVDRLGQIEPKVLFFADRYFYKGKSYDTLDKVQGILSALPSVQLSIAVAYSGKGPDVAPLTAPTCDAAQLDDLLLRTEAEPSFPFAQVPFDHPLYILFSSGTTGKPKCIVHGVGGTLIEHLKELMLHTDLQRDDRIFYSTTCGWMMWNWLASSLAAGATLLLYDGAPLHDEGRILFDLADQEDMTIFGTSAAYLSAIEKAGLRPAQTHDLRALRTLLSAGSPLRPDSYDYVYTDIKQDLCLSSISGGTDIVGCFALGCPALPVHRGELQIRSLGYAVDVFDDNGRSVRGEKGELVCTAPFPSMPIGFWNDPDGVRYRKSYFDRFDNVWHHGDYVMLTDREGMIFYGRSDAVLNPGGVRIGTAEIYRPVEQIPEVESSVAVGQKWSGEVRVVLFVKLKKPHRLDDSLRERIRSTILKHTTPRHVPAKILQVDDIPLTRSGKISELAVRDTIHGIPVTNREALANPESLQCFVKRPELAR